VNGKVLAACDSELIGSTIEENDFEINLNPSFYGEKTATEEEFLKLLEEYDNVNLVGENAVSLALKNGKVVSYREIKRVKFAMIFKVWKKQNKQLVFKGVKTKRKERGKEKELH